MAKDMVPKEKSAPAKAMQAHGYSRGDGKHKRHPATSGSSAFGKQGNRFERKP